LDRARRGRQDSNHSTKGRERLDPGETSNKIVPVLLLFFTFSYPTARNNSEKAGLMLKTKGNKKIIFLRAVHTMHFLAVV
jgi:hypothetical protein